MRGRGRGRLAHTPTEIACLPVPELLGRFKTVTEADRPCKPTRPPAGSAATDRAKATLPILSAKSLFRGREVGAPSRSHLPATPTHLLPPQRNVRELCWAMTESTSRGTAVCRMELELVLSVCTASAGRSRTDGKTRSRRRSRGKFRSRDGAQSGERASHSTSRWRLFHPLDSP